MSDSLAILLSQTGEPVHIDAGKPRPMRAANLPNALVAAEHKVQGAERIAVAPRLAIRFIASPGYQHAILTRGVCADLP